MGHHHVFLPQASALCHAKSVLLVDDYKSEILELNIVLDHGVSAYEDVQRAVGELAVYDVTLLFAC